MNHTEPSSVADARSALRELGIAPSTEFIDVLSSRAIGRVLAQTLRADRDLPPYDRATMDGYAVRWDDVVDGDPLRIVGESVAGRPFAERLEPGRTIRIATGAAVPSGADTVIERERVRALGDDATVTLDASGATRGRSIHPRGVDAHADDPLVEPGQRIDEVVVGLAATIGTATVEVRRRPRVLLVSTGDELRPPDDPLLEAGDRFRIRNGNGPMIAGTLRRLGADVVESRHVADDRDATVQALRDGLERSDLVLSIGGVSVGDHDHVPAAWRTLGLEPGNAGVRIQPGRPFTWWTLDGDCRAMGLPGNPVSALVSTHLFVRCWLDASLQSDPDASWVDVRLAETVRRNPSRPMARPARLRVDGEDLLATVPRWHGSGDLVHLAGTDGLVMVEEGTASAEAGSCVRFLPWATSGLRSG